DESLERRVDQCLRRIDFVLNVGHSHSSRLRPTRAPRSASDSSAGTRDPSPHRRGAPLRIRSHSIIANVSAISVIVYGANVLMFPPMSSTHSRPDARTRIVRAAVKLLATGGRNAVTTRAVSAAAGVQPPTIYRHFGDMQGLLDLVARETLAVHVREQATRALTDDPVEDLRRGWDLHIGFGLAHPDAFALLYSAPSVAGSRSAIHEGVAVLQGLVARIAEAGRLRVAVARATDLIHAAGTGVTLALAATPPEE